MNRNTPYSFGMAPHESMRRSVLDLSHSLKTSFNVGDIVPIYVDPDILPGDTISIKTSKVVRLQTLIDPIMDDLYLDTYYFFVPHRLVWDHWKEFMGENTSAPWTQTTEYTIPQIESPSGGWNVGTIADYFGIPTGISNISVNALPFRALAMVCNEWFRNENTTNPVNFDTDDTTITGVNTGDQVTDIVKGGLPFKAAKYKDYFTACLPSPQKGDDVLLPLGDTAPVFAGSVDRTPVEYNTIHWVGRYGNLEPNKGYDVTLGTDASGVGSMSVLTPTGTLGTWVDSPIPVNLYSDLRQATGSSVNQLRLAFQIQKMAELDARSGTRYIEKIRAHFGVTSPDARMQRPEYLGGNRISLQVRQVVSTAQTETSASNESTIRPQGTTSAYSLTVDTHGDFSKSFTEHGTLLGLAVVRYKHTYQQGLARCWSRKTINDFYWPILANIGEQPVLNKEIYCSGTSGELADDGVFGYNEAWADYRYKPNRTTGEMRSQAPLPLDSWHLGDDYASCPALSSGWIQEDKTNVDRVLAVTSAVSNQLFGDFHFDVKATRVMPVYSIPGLIDHH